MSPLEGLEGASAGDSILSIVLSPPAAVLGPGSEVKNRRQLDRVAVDDPKLAQVAQAGSSVSRSPVVGIVAGGTEHRKSVSRPFRPICIIAEPLDPENTASISSSVAVSASQNANTNGDSGKGVTGCVHVCEAWPVALKCHANRGYVAHRPKTLPPVEVLVEYRSYGILSTTWLFIH